MKTHLLKIKSEYADAQLKGLKPWELRKNDRDFQIGDVLEFLSIYEDGKPMPVPTYKKEITYIFKGGEYGLQEGFVILSLKDYRERAEIKKNTTQDMENDCDECVFAMLKVTDEPCIDCKEFGNFKKAK